MKAKNFWIAVVSGSVLSLLVSNLPFVGFVNCLLCAGFWGSAIFAVWLYRRLEGTLVAGQSFRIGLLTGVLAGVLGFPLSFLGVSDLQDLMNEFGDGAESVPLWGSVIFNLFGVIFNIVFGMIGGWLGGLLFRTDRVTQTPSSTQTTN